MLHARWQAGGLGCTVRGVVPPGEESALRVRRACEPSCLAWFDREMSHRRW